MALDDDTARLRGLLVGNGFKVLCAVQAKHTNEVGSRNSRTEYKILEIDEPLPEGRYWLAVNSQTFDADYKNKRWLVHQ
jgi:hypothetical protein